MSALIWPAVILAFILLGCAASVWAICTKSPSDDEIRVPMREDYRPEGEAWDRHVNDALAMVETPIYDDLAVDVAAREAAGLDDEWLWFGGAR